MYTYHFLRIASIVQGLQHCFLPSPLCLLPFLYTTVPDWLCFGLHSFYSSTLSNYIFTLFLQLHTSSNYIFTCPSTFLSSPSTFLPTQLHFTPCPLHFLQLYIDTSSSYISTYPTTFPPLPTTCFTRLIEITPNPHTFTPPPATFSPDQVQPQRLAHLPPQVHFNLQCTLLFTQFVYENVVLILHKSSTIYVILECAHPSTLSHNC